MNFGEMKTSFMSIMEHAKISATPFDFAEAIDSAIYFIAINMPGEVIPELVKVYTTDINQYTPRQVTLPKDYLHIMSARLGKERSIISLDPTELGVPIYLPATIVSQREFTTKSQYSNETLVSLYNGVLNYNPELVDPLVDYPGPVELTYKRIPVGYIRRYNKHARGALISSLDQDQDNPSLLTMTSIGNTWADHGLETTNLVGGNIIFKYFNNVYIGNIDYAWDDEGGIFSGLHIREDLSIGLIASGLLTIVHVTEARDIYTGGGTFFEDDTTVPDLPSSLHRLALDYAIGKFLLSRNPQVAQNYMSLVIETFKSYGVNLKMEYGGEER